MMMVSNKKSLGRWSYFYKALLYIGAIVLIVLLFPKEYKFKYHFTQDKPWVYEDLFAPFDFAVNKTEEELEKDRNDIIDKSIPYFITDTGVVPVRRRQLLIELGAGNSESGPNANIIRQKLGLSIFDSIYKKGVLRYDDILKNKDENFTIYLVNGNVVDRRTLSEIYNLEKAHDYILSQLHGKDGIDADFLLQALEKALIQNVSYSPEITNHENFLALKSISSTKGYIQKNERIISKGELITPRYYQILLSLKKQYEGESSNIHSHFFIVLGQIILTSIAMIMLVLFLLMFRADIIANTKKNLLILTVLMLVIVSASIIVRRYGYEYIYVLPLCVVPLMIRTFFDTRLALFVHLISIILIGFLVPNGFEFIFLQLIAGIVTIISTVRLEKRSQFFITSLYIFCTYSLIYVGMTMMMSGSYKDIVLQNFMFFAFNSVLTLAAYPLIVLFERIFGYVTNVSLLEYSNTNNTLLRELSQKAPGTFQHSLQVANLAEEAAHRIGANALLVRAGAMFHDIGKVVSPVYFIENQLSSNNPHDKLSYAESAEIITRHIENGIILARKYGIPEQIIDFIRTHHGTKRTEYFYRLYKNKNGEKIDESVFYYPGPVPFSKETAILMMADTVEAAAKSMKVHNKQSIDDLVDQLIDCLIADKQMKNANITLKDITRVKSVLKNRLISMYHVRIEYPKMNAQNDGSTE
ncbi:MAG: HDIG domain-containing protein [Bacteroidales bacterium]|nr:HDIG domain-containing protein [Bacteroidales bacterium]